VLFETMPPSESSTSTTTLANGFPESSAWASSPHAYT